jgi:hypothetical protein
MMARGTSATFVIIVSAPSSPIYPLNQEQFTTREIIVNWSKLALHTTVLKIAY